MSEPIAVCGGLLITAPYCDYCYRQQWQYHALTCTKPLRVFYAYEGIVGIVE